MIIHLKCLVQSTCLINFTCLLFATVLDMGIIILIVGGVSDKK